MKYVNEGFAEKSKLTTLIETALWLPSKIKSTLRSLVQTEETPTTSRLIKISLSTRLDLTRLDRSI